MREKEERKEEKKVKEGDWEGGEEKGKEREEKSPLLLLRTCACGRARVRECGREEERRNVGRGRERTGGTPLVTEKISAARGIARVRAQAREKGRKETGETEREREEGERKRRGREKKEREISFHNFNS